MAAILSCKRKSKNFQKSLDISFLLCYNIQASMRCVLLKQLMNMRVQFNGSNPSLPSWLCGFDSNYLLHSFHESENLFILINMKMQTMRHQLSWIEQRPSKPWVGGSNPFEHMRVPASDVSALNGTITPLWWVQRSWLARQIVALEAQGSNPCIHPVAVATIIVGLSPSGKAQDFDSCIRWFESNQPSLLKN